MVVNDLGKIAVIAGILGALLIFGLLLQTPEPERALVASDQTVTEEPPPEVTVLPPMSLELLDPIYSEKAVFHDDTLRIAFNASFVEDGVQSRLPFWLHNVSDDVITVLWDRCSIQLPSGNTFNVVSESAMTTFVPGEAISVAPTGDLFDAVIPVSEIDWEAEGGPDISTGVFDQGTFTFVLAIERSAGLTSCIEAPPSTLAPRRGAATDAMQWHDATECAEAANPASAQGGAMPQSAREIVYYTFRFIIR